MEEEVKDLEQRLEVPQVSFQRDAVTKALLALLGQQAVNTGSPHFRFLTRCFTHSSLAVSETAITAVARLVKEKKMEAKQAITELLNYTPSVSLAAFPTAVSVVTDLLFTYFIKPADDGASAVSGSFYTHPYVSLLNQRPEAWQHLLHVFVDRLVKEDDLMKMLSAFAPWTSHVLLNPQLYAASSSTPPAPISGAMAPILLRSQLHTQLVRLGMTTEYSDVGLHVFATLISFLPFYRSEQDADVLFIVNAIGEILDLAEALLDDEPDDVEAFYNHGQALLEHLVQLLHEERKRDRSLIILLSIMRRLLFICPSLFTRLEHFTAILSFFLFNSTSETEQKEILGILSVVINALPASSTTIRDFVLPFVIFPLLHSVSSSPVDPQVRILTSKLLNKVEAILQTKAKPDTQAANGEAMELIEEAGLVDLFRQAEKLQTWLLGRGGRTAQRYVESMKDRLSAKEQTTPFFFLFVSALIVHPKASLSVQISLMDIAAKIAQLDALKAISLLPLLVYKLGKCQDPDVQLKLLYTLPTLGTHTACVGPVLRTINSLASVRSLHPISIRLLGRLWDQQPRMFPRLQSALNEYHPEKMDEDLRISIASVIRDVCMKDSDAGVDLITPLSSIITKDVNPVCVALGLESLTALCQDDAVDFKTAWGVIGQTLDQENRPLVLAYIARFFACGAPELEPEDDEFDDFTTNIIGRLWRGTKHDNFAVREASFQALKTYAQHNANSVGPLTDASPALYASLLKDQHPKSRKAAEEFVSVLVGLETSQRRRLSGPSQFPNPALKHLEALPEYLASTYEGVTRPSVRSGLATAVLYSFQPPAPRSADSTAAAVRRHVINKGRAYRRALTDLIADIGASPHRDWVVRATAMNPWVVFFRQAFPVLVEAEAAKRTTKTEEEHVIDKQLTMEVAELMTAELKKKCEESPGVAENAVCALGALALALPASVHSQIEVICDTLMNLFRQSEGNNEWRSYACLLSLATVTHALHPTDTARMSEIVSLLSENLAHNENEWVKFASGLGLGIVSSALFRQSADEEMDEDATGGKRSKAMHTESDVVKRKLFASIVDTLKSTVFGGFPELPLEGMLANPQGAYTAQLPSSNTASFHWGMFGSTLGLAHIGDALESLGDGVQLQKWQGLCANILRMQIAHTGTSATSSEEDKPEGEGSEATDATKLLVNGLLLALSTFTARAFRLDLASASDVASVLNDLQTLVEKQQENSNAGMTCKGVALIAYATLLHDVVNEGFTVDTADVQKTMAKYAALITSSENPNFRVGVLVSMANFLGAQLLVPPSVPKSYIESLAHMSPALSKKEEGLYAPDLVDKIMNALKQSFASDPKPRICKQAVRILGVLSRPFPAEASETNIPANLNYLPDTSIVRAFFDVLKSASITKDLASVSVPQVESILACLTAAPKLPSVNWARLIQQLMKASLGLTVRLRCINFAIKHSTMSALIALLASWYDATRFATLEPSLQSALYEALPRLLPLFPSTISRNVIATLFLLPFPESPEVSGTIVSQPTRELRRHQHTVAVLALTSLNATVAEGSKLPSPVISELHAAVLEVYRRLPGPLRVSAAQQAGRKRSPSVKVDTKRMQQVSLLTSSLASLPPLLLESSLPPDAQYTKAASASGKQQEQASELEAAAKSIILRSLLVEQKVLPLSSLHACRTWCLSQSGEMGRQVALALMGFVVGPLLSFDAGTKRKWIIDTLDTLLMCSNLELGLHFLTFVCSSFAAGKLDTELLFRYQGANGASTVPLRALPHILTSILSRELQRDESLLSAVGPRVLELTRLSGKKQSAAVRRAEGEELQRTQEARRFLIPALLQLRHSQFVSQRPGLLLDIMTHTPLSV